MPFQKGNKIGFQTRFQKGRKPDPKAYRCKLSEEHKRRLSQIKKGKMPKNIFLLHSPEMRAKAKIAMNKGGILRVKVYKHYRNIEYRNWRKKVFERDNYTCLNCGISKVYLYLHHIKSYTYYFELRYEVNNGVTLCIPCHHQLHFGH